MKQVGRNLTDAKEGFLRGATLLLLDRDPLYTKAFRKLLRQSGVKPIVLPARSPNLKGRASHYTSFVRSDKTCGPGRRSESFCPCCLRGLLLSSVA